MEHSHQHASELGLGNVEMKNVDDGQREIHPEGNVQLSYEGHIHRAPAQLIENREDSNTGGEELDLDSQNGAAATKRNRAGVSKAVKVGSGSTETDGQDLEAGQQEDVRQLDQPAKLGSRKSKRQRTQDEVLIEGSQADAAQSAGLHIPVELRHSEPQAEMRDVSQSGAEPGHAGDLGKSRQKADPEETAKGSTVELKYSPLQLKAWIMTQQPLDVPGYQWPCPLPHVLMGARWQLDLRTGERLEEANSVHLNMSHLHGLQTQNPNSFTIHNAALAAQALGSRPMYAGSQTGQTYGVVPSGAQYSAMAGLQGPEGTSGPYTSLLAPQMLAQGLMAPQAQPNLGAVQNLPPAFQHLVHQLPSRRHRAPAVAQEGEDVHDIPLRRRGRPAGDGSGPAASPMELQERRMQANRAAASRSHFRRKREMEMLDKDCAVAEARIQELRMSIATLMQQEEQLRMQQQTIRNQLAAGIKPDESLSLPAVFHVLGSQHEHAAREEADQAALTAILQAQMGSLGGTSLEAV